ncbi:MAG TPA: polysaccharide deacetylase family protein [Clostridiaceae bacterium]
MVKITKLFPKGYKKALTLSYDDGITQDQRLVKIFNKYALKATFNLNSGLQSDKNFWVNNGVTIKRTNENEILDLYKGHEIAIHTLTHPHLEDLPKALIIEEVLEDKKNLEALFECPIRGMAYPFGTYNNTVIEVLETLGVEYSRTVNQHSNFSLPENPLTWNPTCHHSNPKLMELAKSFVNTKFDALSLFYVWGHSYEFDVDKNWELIENFCEYISQGKDIWYATNIEIIDYLKALENLKFSSELSTVYNPSALSIWIEVKGIAVEIKSGELKKLA